MTEKTLYRPYLLLVKGFMLVTGLLCAGMTVVYTGELIRGYMSLIDYGKALLFFLLTYKLFVPVLMWLVGRFMFGIGRTTRQSRRQTRQTGYQAQYPAQRYWVGAEPC